MMICYSLKTIATKVGLGDVTELQDTYFATKKGIYCFIYDMTEIIRLQQIYGTGLVNYCPFPTIILKKEGSNVNKGTVAILSKSLSTDITTAKASIMQLNMKFIHHGTSSMNMSSILDAISDAKVVVVNGDVRTNVLYVLFASAKPFIIIGHENPKIRKLLELCSLEKLICNSRDSEVLMSEVWENRSEIIEVLQTTSLRLQAFISWAPYAKAFSSSYNDVELDRDPSIDFKFTFSPSDYSQDPYTRNLSTQLYSYSTTNGINYKLSVFKEFTKSGIVLLHPWIGFVETLNPEDVRELLKNDRFLASSPFCIGLYVFNREIYDEFPDSYALTIIDYPLIRDSKSFFDYESWKTDRVLVNLLNKKEIVSLNNNKDYNTIDFVACLSKASYENASKIAVMATRGVPIILPKTAVSIAILGKRYPLYRSDVNPSSVQKWITNELVFETSEYLQSILRTSEELVDILSDTAIGKTVSRLFR